MFRTYEPEQDRLVAVKVFRLDITPEQAARLADALGEGIARVPQHPSLVRTYRAGVEGTLAYLAEEYVAAESLDVAMRHYAPATYQTVTAFIGQLSGAIDAARASGIHHGSLHPRDVFLTPDLARANGFGIGQALEAIGLRPPVRRPYTPPERIAAGEWGPAADVFSLAAVAFELITGRRVTGIGHQISLGTRQDDPRITQLVTRVLARAMAEDPAERFDTARAFAAALESAVAGERPPSEQAAAEASAAATPRKAVSRSRRRKTAPAVAAPTESPAPGAEPPESAPEPVLQLEPEPPSAPAIAESRLPATDADEDPRLPGGLAPEGEAVETIESGEEPAPAIEPFSDQPAFDDPWSEDSMSARDEADGGPWQFDEETAPGALDDAEPVEAESAESDDLETWAIRDGSMEYEPVAAAGSGVAFESSSADESPSPWEDARQESARPVLPPPRADGPGARRGATLTSMGLVLVLGVALGFAGGYFTGFRQAVGGVPGGLGEGQRAGAADADLARSLPEAPQGSQARRSEAPRTTGTTGAVAAPAALPPPLAGGPSTSSQGRADGGAAAPALARPAPAATATPAAAPARAPVRGRLLVRSTPPGAEVRVNGRVRGETPFELADLSPGRYTIEVREAGYVAQSKQVSVTAARPTAAIDVSLARAVPSPEAARAGSLEVDSRPRGARVYFNDRLIGETPLVLATVPLGTHRIRLELEGHRAWSTSVTTAAGRRDRVAGSLEPQ